ncbi:helix-turn-helix domain-containing protein [Nocardioides sp.]|uniref:TetR/AcrR family transcriptional regulator n=1 Tax=Nocardioides sp. TaxID=35761 RepID=UPI001A2E6867|nr:helix-turn-helix domain-containing protein [Nocardioides sp.]MBJ7357287.1 helix-turn-helix transcriptional regulator [Nocardioides sp.]
MSSHVSTLPRQELNARQAETVERLLTAAAEELRTVGPESVTVRTVAGRAGVSPATAYTYFASRNHLFAELFWRKVLLEHPAEISGTTPLARVQSVTRQLSAVLAESPHLAAAANHALLGTDPDVERLRTVIGLDMFGRFREALGESASEELLDALAMVQVGTLLQTGMGLISYDDLAARFDALVATVMKGNV